MRLKERFQRRTLIIVGAVLILSLGATVAYAAVTSFSDVPADYWAYASITKLASQGIIQGRADGTFGPDQNITRAQAATMFDREQQYLAEQAAAPLANIARGCPACHPTAAATPNPSTPFAPGQPDPARGNAPRYGLKWESMGSDATVTPTRFTLHNTLADTATVNTCLGCHAAGNADSNGNASPISLRTIAHPAHLYSGIFLSEFRGNCFTCHEITNSGEYDILTQAVTTNAQGIPETIPIPGAQEPSGPPTQ